MSETKQFEKSFDVEEYPVVFKLSSDGEKWERQQKGLKDLKCGDIYRAVGDDGDIYDQNQVKIFQKKEGKTTFTYEPMYVIRDLKTRIEDVVFGKFYVFNPEDGKYTEALELKPGQLGVKKRRLYLAVESKHKIKGKKVVNLINIPDKSFQTLEI